MGSASRQRCGQRSSGFTLVELMVVMVIVTVLGLIVGRALSRPNNEAAVRRYAHEVLVAIRQARAEAVNNTRMMQLSFRSDGRAFSLDGASLLGPGPPAGSVWQPVASVEAGANAYVQALTEVATPTAVTDPGSGGLTDGPVGIVEFFPDGSATPRTVYIRDESGSNKAKVVLFGVTGYAHLIPSW